jgi:hypothetical protein
MSYLQQPLLPSNPAKASSRRWKPLPLRASMVVGFHLSFTIGNPAWPSGVVSAPPLRCRVLFFDVWVHCAVERVG